MKQNPKILFISHDANRAGAQLFLLNIMRYFHKNGSDIHLLLLENGSLVNEFREISKVHLLPNTENNLESKKEKILKKLKIKVQKIGFENEKAVFLQNLSNQKFDLIYINTIACADAMPEILAHLISPIITHIHELEYSISLYSKPENRKYLFEKSHKIIACSQSVAENLKQNHGISNNKIEVIHSFVDNEGILKRIENTDNEAIKQKYQLPKNAYLIGGCGNAEWRKGVDIFVFLALKFLNLPEENIHFIWIGTKKEGDFYEKIIFDAKKLKVDKMITFIEPTAESVELINCLDVFVLTSREDPFPLVMLEAALAKKMIVGFKKSGGVAEFVGENAGLLANYGNLTDFFHKIMSVKEQELSAKEFGENAKKNVLEKYNFETSIKKIENLISSFIHS